MAHYTDSMSYVLAGSIKEVKDLISKKDEVKIDNYLFKLHHQVSPPPLSSNTSDLFHLQTNFIILLIGLAFTFAENYIDGDVIECAGDGVTAYTKKFCFLHGTGYIAGNPVQFSVLVLCINFVR